MKKKIVLISGKKRSGKNSIFNQIKKCCDLNHISCSDVAFAKALKERAYEDTTILIERINNLVTDLAPNNIFTKLIFNKLYNKLYNELFTTKTHFGDGDKTLISRTILEFYGTNIFRNRVDQNYWLNLGIEDMKAKLKSNDVVIVTDARFENEIDEVKTEFKDTDVEIKTIRVNRPELIDNNNHISNTALDDYDGFDLIINENKLDELFKRANEYFENVIK